MRASAAAALRADNPALRAGAAKPKRPRSKKAAPRPRGSVIAAVDIGTGKICCFIARVAAAVRVGGRRWTLHLDNGIDVELPEEKLQEAWAQLAQLERTNRLLARDVQVVDMRLPDRLVVRVTPEPPKEPAKKGRQAAKNT